MTTRLQQFRRLPIVLTAVVAVVLGMLLVPSATAGSGTYVQPAGARLRALADQQGLRLGSFTTAGSSGADSITNTISSNEFNNLRPSRNFKWLIVEPVQGSRDYSEADQQLAWAQQHNMKVHAINLVYHHTAPDWLWDLTNQEIWDAMEDWITESVSRFGPDVWAWTVVAEPFLNVGGGPFMQRLGIGYIAQAFEWAHAANPNVKLFMDVSDLEWTDNTRYNQLIDLLEDLVAQDVPIDGVLWEGHRYNTNPIGSGLKAKFQQVADLGLDFGISAMTVAISPPVTQAKLEQQGAAYVSGLNACLATGRCADFTVEFHSDRRNAAIHYCNKTNRIACRLWDEDFLPKPAYYALQKALGATSPRQVDAYQATADSYVSAGQPATNFGTEDTLRVKTDTSAHWSYFKFNLAGVNPANVERVHLRLNGGTTNSTDMDSQVFAVANTGWSETGITWNNKPATGSALDTATIRQNCVFGGQEVSRCWHHWVATNYVKSELTAGRTTISLAVKNLDPNTLELQANSREATTNQPHLQVVVKQETGGGGGAPVGHTIRLNSVGHGNYVKANTAKTPVPLEATVPSNPGTSTELAVEDAGGGKIRLKSLANGKYVKANTAKPNTPLEATVTTPGTAENFTWQDIGTGKIRLIAAANNKWVSAAPWATDFPLLATVASNPGTYTEFTWDDLGLT